MFFVNTEKIFGSEISREIINKGVSKFNSFLSLYKSSENSNFGINIRLIDMIIIELYEQYTNYVSSENSIKTEDASQLWIDNYSNNFALNINDKSLKYLKLLNLFMRLPVENNVINLGLLADKKLRHIFLQHNIVSLEDLKNVFDKGLYLEIFELYDELVEVLNFLSENLFEKVRESFKKILNVKVVANNLQIIKDRQKGYTLEQIGKIYGVTRERIRQRETRAIKTICKLLNNSIYLNNRKIMCAVANNYYYISLDKLEEIFREDYDVLLLAISKPGCLSEFKYIEELSLIDISENNIFSDILDDLSKLPELFTKDELSTIISNLKNDYEDIINLDELIYGFIEKKYSVSGELIHKNKVSYREKYKVIMEKYFNDGININSEEEIELFKLYYKKEFESDDIDDKSIRSIQGVLAYICVIVGRGKYNLKEKIKSIPLDLLKKIEDYITDKKLIMYNELYKIFQLELESNNVNSPRELHGILKVQSKNKFNFTKDYITIDQFKNSTKEIIEEYAQNYKRISMVQLKKAFPNLNESVLYNNMLSNEKFIALQNKEWYVFNREDYFKEDIEKLDKLIQALIKEYEIVNSRHIYDSTIVMYPDIIEKYHIVNRHQLFGIVKNIFNDKYQFKVSKVAKHGVEINNSIERVKEFIYSYNEIAIYDIRDFIEDNYLNIYSFYDQIILEIINDYIWLDKDKFIKLENIDVQEKVIDEIENYFTYLLSFRKQIIVDDSFDFTFMPKIKYKWNKYLLFSVIYSQSKKLKILSTTNNYLTTDFLVVKNGSDITSNNE